MHHVIQLHGVQMNAPTFVRVPTLVQSPFIRTVIDADLQRFDFRFGNKASRLARVGCMQIHRQLSAHAAAHQLVYGRIQRFAGQIPQRHFHPADGSEVGSAHSAHEDRRGRATRRKMLPAPQVEENGFNIQRVPACERRADVVVNDVLRADGVQHLARAGQALVGVDADEPAIESVAQTNRSNFADGEAGGVRGSLAPRVEQQGAVSHRSLAKKHASIHRAGV